MGNYEQLKVAVASIVRDNGAEEITGNVLQSVLISIINSVGSGAVFAGIATPSTSPSNPDPNMFYIAVEAGTYPNFNLTVTTGMCIFSNESGTWVGHELNVSSQFESGEYITEVSITDTLEGAETDNLPTVGAINGAVTALNTAITTERHDRQEADGNQTVALNLEKTLRQQGDEANEASVGYYVCDTSAATAAKVVNASGYVLRIGGNIRIEMTHANTASNVTLNVNGTGAKALFYNGTQASADNSWADGEVLEVYYDGIQYQCVHNNIHSESPIDVKNGDNEHLIDFVDKDGYLIYYVDSDYRFHALGNDSDESDDGEMPSKGLVKALINAAISDIDIHSIDLDTMVGDNEHLVDFCDERGNLVFYVDSDFTFHALMSNISFHLPSVINTYIGDTLQLFYYPTFISQEYRNVGVNMFVHGEALNGKSFARYSEYTPATAGTKTMKCTALDTKLGLLSQKTVSVNVVTPTSPSSMKNILLVGDSETEGYVNNSRVSPSADGQTTSMRFPYGKELQRLLTSNDTATDTSPAGLGLSNIQLIGHLRVDVRHEGYGGRSTSWFMGSSSPFYINGAIDFNAYLSQDSMYSDTSHKGVDYIYILLGANDGVTVSMVGGKLVLDASTYKTGMVALLDKIKSQIINGSGTYANPNLKVILLSYVLSNPTGGAYHILGQGEYDNGMKQALAYYQYHLVNEELAAMSDYSGFVESVFVSPQIDSENAYAYINKKVNAYLSETERQYVENIHPNTVGYKMYGHAVARDILSRI